jgi:SOUL heme-binding protein
MWNQKQAGIVTNKSMKLPDESLEASPARTSKQRAKLYWLLAGVVCLIMIAAGAAGPITSQVEQPEYQIVTAEDPLEIRSYGAMIAAEAEVQGERKTAINEGFRLIAAYIFGANKTNVKIAMTAPVQQQSQQTIAMTAPVTQQADGNAWTVRFIMPRSWTMGTLPAPNDARVSLKPIPAKRMVAIRFSGLANGALIQMKTAELRKYASEHKLKTVGEPLLAFYNPPWTLPFFRRNEIMLELAESSDSG